MGHATNIGGLAVLFLPACLKNKNTKDKVQSVKEWKKYKVYFWKGWKNTKKTYKNTRCNYCSYFVFSVKKQNNYKHVQNKNKINTTAISQKYKIQKHTNPKLQ